VWCCERGRKKLEYTASRYSERESCVFYVFVPAYFYRPAGPTTRCTYYYGTHSHVCVCVEVKWSELETTSALSMSKRLDMPEMRPQMRST
jgi:hypothetical protein